MFYTFDSRIRYSETDSEGYLTLPALMNYFQDCSTFQSEVLGVGIDYMRKQHLVWVLCSWQIEVNRFPKLCEEVEIGTAPTDFKSFLGDRNFWMKDKQGEFIAKANSLWSLLNTDTVRPVQAPADMTERYGREPKLEMEYASRKITLPSGEKAGEPIPVRPQHLDTNYHVNNGQYISIAMDCLAEQNLAVGPIRRMRAEYKKQAFLNDILYPYVVRTQEAVYVSLRDAQGKVYVNIEFC